MPRFTITIVNTRESFACADDEDVLRGMERLARKGIPVGCRNGGCGVCKVQVSQGAYHKCKMSRAVVSEADEVANCVLACRIKPLSDLTVEVLGKMAKAVEEKQPVVGFHFSRSTTTTKTKES